MFLKVIHSWLERAEDFYHLSLCQIDESCNFIVLEDLFKELLVCLSSFFNSFIHVSINVRMNKNDRDWLSDEIMGMNKSEWLERITWD